MRQIHAFEFDEYLGYLRNSER